MQMTRFNSMSYSIWHSWQSSSNPSYTRLESTYNWLQSKSPVQSMGHQTFQTLTCPTWVFVAGEATLLTWKGSRDQDMELNQLRNSFPTSKEWEELIDWCWIWCWLCHDLLHSETFFTPNHHVGHGIASYLHSPLTLASLWDDSGKIEPRIALVRMYTDAVEMYQKQSSQDYRTENNLKKSTIGSISQNRSFK